MQTRNAIINWGTVALLSVAVAVGLNNLLSLVNLAQFSKRYQETVVVLYSPSFGQQILWSGMVIPMIEEVLFRGVLFRVLRKWCSFSWAMLISAVAFGAYHGNLVQFVYATICGALLAYLYEAFSTVVFSIWSHMMMNVSSIVLTQIGAFTWMMENPVRIIVVMLLCTGISVCLLRLLQKKMLQKC